MPAVVKEAYHCCFLFAFIGSSEYIEGTAIVVALVYVNLPEVNVNPACSSESFLKYYLRKTHKKIGN